MIIKQSHRTRDRRRLVVVDLDIEHARRRVAILITCSACDRRRAELKLAATRRRIGDRWSAAADVARCRRERDGSGAQA